jgi:hypothetical protein
MKRIQLFPALVLLLPIHAHGADRVSIEEFKKLPGYSEREKVIEDAPIEQQEELKKLNLHLALLEKMGTEEDVRRRKIRLMAQERGLGPFLDIFNLQMMTWDFYTVNRLEAAEKAGLGAAQFDELAVELDVKSKYFRERTPTIDKLVYETTASSKAEDLAKKCQTLNDEWSNKYGGKLHPPPITQKEMESINGQVEEILTQIKRLPKIPPNQLEKEYEDFPEMTVWRSLEGATVLRPR